MQNSNQKFEFNYASFLLKPYKQFPGNSSTLLRNIIKKLNDPDFKGEERIVNRNENKKNSLDRKLVVISPHFEPRATMCFGKIALIKNKAPKIWGGADLIEEIEKPENKNFIEVTNYVIYFEEKGDPIIMHEFNSEGPRLSDIEFYLRQIAAKFKIAKAIKPILHIKTDYEQLGKSLRNIFSITVKVKSAFLKNNEWLLALQNLNDSAGYRDVRLEFFYKRIKDPNGKYTRNIKGTEFARNILSFLKKNRNNIKYLDDLKMSYQVDDTEDIINLDFLKERVSSIVYIPLVDGKSYNSKDFKTIVVNEFNHYLETGTTSLS
jgi:hypothetical protein